jgi:RecB family exonuclease
MVPSPLVLIHPDFLRLENELARRIRELRAGSAGTAPILVVAPSLRQVQRLREGLAAALGAVLGVECTHYQALAYRILGARPAPAPPAVASETLLETLVRRILDGAPDLPLARYGRDRAAAARALLRIFTELREAGLGPSDLDGTAGVDPQVPRLLERYETALGALEGAGWSDRAGLGRRARDAAHERDPYLAVFAYGGYELIGANLELLRALPSGNPVVYLVPSDAEAPAWAFARRFVRRHLNPDATPLDGDEPLPPFLASARGFWNREVPPPPFDPGQVRLIHVQGPEAELTVAARKALAWIRSGVPPHEIAIVARTLEPYAVLAETVFDRHGLHVDTSLPRAASRLPRLRALRLLLRVLGRDFERQPVVELVRSRLLLRPRSSAKAGNRWRPEDWDQWSRAYGIARGAQTWTTELPWLLETQPPPPWMKSDPEKLREFETRCASDADSARILGGLIAEGKETAEAWGRCGTGAEHARFLGRLARRWIRGFRAGKPGPEPDDPVRTGWERILDELTGLEAARGLGEAAAPLAVPQVLDFLERALEAMTVPDPAPSGVGFLDLMQSRGLLFSHVVLIGFNAGLVPRRRREDPFLPDAARRALIERTGKPLAEPSAGRDEERLLWAQTVAAARASLTVVWQSADAEGKARPPSPYLAELCRALPGSPPVRAVLAGETPWTPSRLPAHPSRAALWLLNETGLVTREEGAVLAADSGSDSVSAVAGVLGGLDPGLYEQLKPGLAMIRALESFDGSLEYDAFVPEADPEERAFSASTLKRLGRCPLTFFFRHVLRIQPLDETIKEFRLDARELGTHVHSLLESVYRDLHARGFLRGEDEPEALVAAGRESLDRRYAGLLESLGRRLERRFPLFFEHTKSVWRVELEGFLEKDLRRLAAGGHRLDGLETEWRGEASIPWPDAETPRRLTLTGFPDRVTRDRNGRWLISDYKTGGKLEKWILPEEYLKFRQVQLPFYAVLAETVGKTGPVESEALGLGPAFFPERGFVRAGPVTLDRETFSGDIHRGFLESLAVLDLLSREGRFPFKSEFTCQWCEFHHACRRHHYPSRERVERHPEYRLYFAMQGKAKTKPLLPPEEHPA